MGCCPNIYEEYMLGYLPSSSFEDNRAIFKQLHGIEKFNVTLNIFCWFNELDLAPEFIKKWQNKF